MLNERIDRATPRNGTWGPKPRNKDEALAQTTSKVRIPARMIGRLIGERGKTITEISRDTKTSITIPQNEEGNENVILEVKGTKENIKAAQFLMQRVLKK